MIIDYNKYVTEADPFRNNLAKFVYVRTYSRWIDSLSRRETWFETVERVTNYLGKTSNWVLPEEEYGKIFSSIYYLEALPSMRLMWTAGDAADKNHFSIYNCSYMTMDIDCLSKFGELMYILMHGVGGGYSVESKFVSKIPRIKPFNGKVGNIVVEDSKEGWAGALMEACELWWGGYQVTFDLSKVRKKGARLKTFGGRASGPEPLKEVFDFMGNMVERHRDRFLSTVNVHDICCMIAKAIVVGGVRRSALISLSDLYDEGMKKAKDGQFWNKAPQRAMSNNSAVYEHKPSAKIFMDEWLNLANSGSGERGIINRGAMKNQIPKRRKYVEGMGVNPCAEIILRDRGLCNLSEVVLRANDTFDTVMTKVRTATIIGTIQSMMTNFGELVDPKWKKNAEEERLLGVSITGQMDNPDILTEDNLESWKDYAIGVNIKFAKQLGINRSKAITCGKPSGTASQVVDSSSGFHCRFSNYYIRRVRISASDPLYLMMKAQGVKFYPEVGEAEHNATTFVCEFPIKSPEGSITADNLTGIDQLEQWLKIKKHWAEHTVSATIYVEEHEWFKVGNWVYEHFDDVLGLSFLPKADHVYHLAPYEAISKEQYEKMVAEEVSIDYSLLSQYELEDMGEGAKTLACEGDKCILK